MSTAALIQHIDDRINPIVVKELRQAVAGRFVAAVLLLFLIIQLLVLTAFVLADTGTSRELDGGYTAFMWMRGIVLGVTLLFIPAYAAARFSAERSDTNLDLLFVTTIRPSSIVWGKFLSAMVVTLMIYSACLPFLSLTYLLRGIDLPTILITLAFDALIVASAVMTGLFIACIPANRVAKALLGLIAGLGVLGWFLGSVFAPPIVRSVGMWGVGDWWWQLATLVVGFVSSDALLFFISVAMLSPPSSNRAMPVRIYLLASTVAMGLFALAASGAMGNLGPMVSWTNGSICLMLIALLVSISERGEWGPRVLSAVPRSGLLRPVAFLLFSGAAGGTVFCLLVMAGVIAASALLAAEGVIPSGIAGFNPADTLEPFIILALYGAAYALTALGFRRLFKLPPSTTWAFALVLMAVGTLVPFLVAFMIDVRGWDRVHPAVFVTVPFWWMNNSHGTVTGWYASGVWAAAALAWNIPWIVGRYRVFKRPQTRVAAEAAVEPVV